MQEVLENEYLLGIILAQLDSGNIGAASIVCKSWKRALTKIHGDYNVDLQALQEAAETGDLNYLTLYSRPFEFTGGMSAACYKAALGGRLLCLKYTYECLYVPWKNGVLGCILRDKACDNVDCIMFCISKTTGDFPLSSICGAISHPRHSVTNLMSILCALFGKHPPCKYQIILDALKTKCKQWGERPSSDRVIIENFIKKGTMTPLVNTINISGRNVVIDSITSIAGQLDADRAFNNAIVKLYKAS